MFMAKKKKTEVVRKEVSFSDLVLDLNNPRHGNLATQKEVIEYLCAKEKVFELAKDIVEQENTNPLEITGVLEISKGRTKTYIVLEGNRRICALKCIADPSAAPSSLHDSFEALLAAYQPPQKIFVTIFKERNDAEVWLDRIHMGEQDGIGRRRWDTQQKGRRNTSGRDQLAISVLDHLVQKKVLSKADLEKKKIISTMTRFLGNPTFRNTLGISSPSAIAPIELNRSVEDFEKRALKFVTDLINGAAKDGSRTSSEKIVEYGNELATEVPISPTTTPSTPLAEAKKRRPKPKPRKPNMPAVPKTIQVDRELEKALEDLGALKLQALYYSICKVELDPHTPLVLVGIWSFLDSLGSIVTQNGTIENIFPKDVLTRLGVTSSAEKSIIQDVMSDIRKKGNSTKHEPVSYYTDGKTLHNHMEVITPLIIKRIEKHNADQSATI